jgi:hypothetical protein
MPGQLNCEIDSSSMGYLVATSILEMISINSKKYSWCDIKEKTGSEL